MDSGLCVLKGPLGMRKRLVNGSALVIMRLYCTKGVHGEVINNYFRSKILVMWDV